MMITAESNRARALMLALCCLCAALGAGACTENESVAPTATTANGNNAGSTTTAPNRATPGAPSSGSTSLPPEIADSTIESLDGESFRLADYQGKVVVLDLWATWCGPCRLEVPHLVAIGNEYGERGVEVIGLSTENPDEASELVRAFAREFNINYKLGWTNPQVRQLIGFGGGVIPQTLVIARDGTVVMHHAGFNPSSTPQKLREAVEQALARQS